MDPEGDGTLVYVAEDKLNLLDKEADASIRLPVLDRFINLLLSLHKPDFYKGINS